MGNCKSIDDDVSQLIGMTLEEADKFVENNDIFYKEDRITWVRAIYINSIRQPLTKERRKDRINVYINNYKITRIDACY